MKQINLRVPEELLARIDAAAGDVPRERWLRGAVEQALSETREPVPSEQADPGSVSSSEGVRPAAPAEQPQTPDYIAEGGMVGPEAYRSSSFAKRDVRPVPKRGA